MATAPWEANDEVVSAPRSARAPAPWEVGDAPAAPAKPKFTGQERTLPVSEIAGRFGSGLLNAGIAGAQAPIIGALTIGDAIASRVGGLFGNKPNSMADLYADRFVQPAMNAVEAASLKPNEDAGAIGGPLIQAAPGLGRMGGDLALGGPLGGASKTLFGPTTAGAATSVAQAVMNTLREGMVTGLPTALRSAGERQHELQAAGASPLEAVIPAAVTGMGTAGQFALPMGTGSALPTVLGRGASRAAQAVAINVPAGVVQRQAENAVLPDSAAKLRADPLDPAALTGDTMASALLSMMGARNRPSAPRARADLGYDKPELTTAPGAADFVPPEAQTPTLDPQAAIKQVLDAIYSGDTSAAPDGLGLVPRGAPTPVSAPDPMLAPRVPDLTLEGDAAPAQPRPMTVAQQVAKDPELTGAVRQLVEADEAFRLARGTPRQDAGGGQVVPDGQAQPDTRGGMLNRKQGAQDDAAMSGQERDLRDASPAGTTTPEGTAATKPETFAFLDATRENGQLNGQQIEVLERMTLQDAKGKPVEAARIRMPDGSEDVVPASRVTELSRPANPRFAQAIESGTYAPKKGVGTGPDQPAPRDAAQRITTKESPEFIPAERGDGNSTPDPRRGTTYENDLPALEGRRQAPPAPDNLLTDNGKRVLANPDTGAPRLPGPERNTPSDGRILVDEGGGARRETYGERGDSAEASGREQFVRDYSRNELGNTNPETQNANRTAQPDNAGANGRPGSDGAGNRGNDGPANGERSAQPNDAGARPTPELAARPDAGGAADNVGAARVASPREVPRLQVEHGKVSTQIKRLQTTLETWRARAAEGGLADKAAAALADKIAGARSQLQKLRATRDDIAARLTPERLPKVDANESILSDLRAEGGVTPAMARDMGIGTADSKLVNGKGLASEDRVVAAAVKKGWLTHEEVQQLGQRGAYEKVIEMVGNERGGDAPRGDLEAQARDRERAELEDEAKRLGVDVTDMTRAQAIDAVEKAQEKIRSREEIEQANEAAKIARDEDLDARTIDEVIQEAGISDKDIEDAKYRREAEIEGRAQSDDARGEGARGDEAAQGGDGEAPRGENEKRPDARPADKPDDGGQRPGLELTSESRADAEQRIKRESDAKREAELASKKADEKAAADKEADRFELSGSDRAADAPGQGDLAGNSPKPDAVRDATYRLNALPLDAAWDGLKRALRHMVSDDAASGPLRKAIADLFSEAKGMNKREALARSLGALVWSDASVLKSVAEARNSPTLGKVWRMFSDMGGTEKIHGETFEQEVHARYNRNANETTDLLKGLSDDQIKQTKALLENRSNIRDGAGGAHKAAKRIAEMLDAERKWLAESGVELGDIKNYVPRVYLAREIAAKAVQFREAATKAYRMMGLDAADAATAADAWYHATRLKGDGVPEVPFLDLTSGAPQKNFTKTREIPIDVIRKSGLDKFLDTDLSGVLDAYYRRTAKRGAFESRFGGTAEDGTGNAKWNEMRKALDKEGNSDLIGFVENRILSMSGQMKADVSDGVRSAMSLARAVTVATFLRRAVVSSLTEPLQVGNRTASAGAGTATANTLKMYARGANDLVRALTGLGKSATREDQYRMARMLGTILHENVESGVAALRFDGDTLPNERGTSVSRVGDRISFAAMKASGLHDWTQANTVDSTIIGMDFIKTMAEDAATGRRLANYELDRLGIAEADHAEFSKYAAKAGNADQLLADMRAGNKQAAQYVGAIDKFTRQVIMKPTAADKPILAKHPVAQMAYGLQSWMYSYWYNVQKANLNQIKEAATGEGYTKGDRATMAAAPVMYTAAVLAMTDGLLTVMRDLVAGRDRDKEREEKNKKAAIMGVPVETLRVLSQAQLFGLADPFINSMTSARYNKLPGSELGGPAFGRVQKFGLTSAGVLSDKNSANTNTAERQKAEAFYNLVIDPTLAVGAASLPMPLAAAATFASQRDELRQAYINQSAGPAKKKATDYTK